MQNLKLYNSLSRKKEAFKPITEGRVGMYVCGPTVYGDAHLGHARPGITFDVVFRYLQHLGYKTRYVRNITDVGHLVNDADEGEDKIAKKAKVANKKKRPASKASSLGGTMGSPMQARAMFNASINEAIRQNMGGAALHNRTGRFADSVYVHNISPTAGTDGTVQYSYMYNPYKVFEGHETRDPRLLIDKTIREQAAELALGKFTTQRL